MKARLIQYWQKLSMENRILASTGALSLLTILCMSLIHSEAPQIPSTGAGPGVDTLIPRGFVLVPIEVENYEALDSILGKFGFVDLFQGAADGSGKQKMVARNVRILRAPQNPSHFAILIRESETDQILGRGGSFTVIVKSSSARGTEFVKTSKRKQRQIIYEGG
jgi:hypothetical protein